MGAGKSDYGSDRLGFRWGSTFWLTEDAFSLCLYMVEGGKGSVRGPLRVHCESPPDYKESYKRT